MTAPAPRPGPDVAERLAEALADWNNLPPMACLPLAQREAVIAALLPVVDAIAAERAAEELKAAAESPYPYDRGRKGLRFRAAALRGEGR